MTMAGKDKHGLQQCNTDNINNRTHKAEGMGRMKMGGKKYNQLPGTIFFLPSHAWLCRTHNRMTMGNFFF